MGIWVTVGLVPEEVHVSQGSGTEVERRCTVLGGLCLVVVRAEVQMVQ